MNRTKEIISLIILICLIIWVGSNVRPNFSEEKNTQIYEHALLDYQNNEFQNAYYLFGKIPKSSKLKAAALYRQGICAQKLDDFKSAIKKYNQLIGIGQNLELDIRARYLKAQTYYGGREYSKARKEFNYIIKKYPQSDYAIASNYYLGLIELEHKKDPQEAVVYFKYYLQNSHDGRFSLVCAQTLARLASSSEINLLIAKAYFASGDYKNAQKYLEQTNIKDSWVYFVKNASKTNNSNIIKYFTERGLQNYSQNIDDENLHEAIDIYLKTQPGKPLDYLNSIAQNSKGYDYIAYKKCRNMNSALQSACFNTLYYKFPNGQFSAEALSKIFYSKIRARNYKEAKVLGKEHLRKFSTTNSAPMVMYWMGKISKGSDATGYYRSVMQNFSDDYYAYLANLKLGEVSRTSLEDDTLNEKPIEFPYLKNENSDFVMELAKVKDYELINDLYKDDLFIQSWLAYKKGNYSNSARLARDAMEKTNPKPAVDDPRWKLVYPVHFYEDIKRSAINEGNNPILMLALIREESYFNPNAKSSVGATGLMQLMPATASEVAKKFAFDVDGMLLSSPRINIKLGNAYYAQLRQTLRGKNELAVLAYNGGAGSVTRWLSSLNFYDTDDFVEQIPYDETHNYLKKVYKSFWNYKRIYQ